ncbi:iron chelate uptake ABC transporter family permease subunit [Alkalibaculum sp. M08DMB]|uniref:Iron chelate uptake ABC transporter family permease subunit n=1 Tax=Alkalibaculum sporogenes TaxID=2655001 RepID=A0A6A7KBY8_9FIRM|nr:iron chelate uptake ABC transporter family permease subunit [Alkalibaculum sporogenes]MPW26934.1 iron chelate uptake ABC transporter family permease subunit [Alkalibaculum sporogenes]
MIKFVKKYLIFLVIIICLATIFICTTIGVANISVSQTVNILFNKITSIGNVEGVKESTIAIIWNLRFPRVMLAFLVGGALSICGVAYQGIFKNPMADPFLLGVSSGAALGATIAIVFNISAIFFGLDMITVFAFVSALLTLLLVYNISRIGNKVPVPTLLLSGIAISQFLTAIISLFMIFSDQMNRVVFWTMGSLNAKSWNHLILILPYVIIGFIILFRYHRQMDIMLLGEDTASQLGVNTEKLKLVILVVTAFITAATVSVTGIIGFVGLIIPHIVRMIVGPKHKKLYPYSFVLGGILLIICDTVARSLINQEIPVGIITAIFGGPFFIYLLKKRKRGGI